MITPVSQHHTQVLYISSTDLYLPGQQSCLSDNLHSPRNWPYFYSRRRPLGSSDSSPPHRRCLVRVGCGRGSKTQQQEEASFGLSSPSQGETPTCPSLLPWAAADADEIDAVDPARLLAPAPPPAGPLLSRAAAAAGAAAGGAGAGAGAGEALTAWLPMPNMRSTWRREAGRRRGRVVNRQMSTTVAFGIRKGLVSNRPCMYLIHNVYHGVRFLEVGGRGARTQNSREF